MSQFDNVSALLFDLDGTLIDLQTRWFNPFIRAINIIKPDYDKGLRELKIQEAFNHVLKFAGGRSWWVKFKLALKISKNLELSLFDIIKGLKLIRADPLAFKEIELLEGAESIIELMHDYGYRLGLVTNAGEGTVKRFKRKSEIMNLFEVMVTRNDTKKLKPAADAVILACELLKLNPKECVMIGDFPADIIAGKAAGTKTVGILGANGKYTRILIEETKPDLIVESILDLQNVFKPQK